MLGTLLCPTSDTITVHPTSDTITVHPTRRHRRRRCRTRPGPAGVAVSRSAFAAALHLLPSCTASSCCLHSGTAP